MSSYSLPWIVCTDEHNNTYYYNQLTQHSQWHVPEEWGSESEERDNNNNAQTLARTDVHEDHAPTHANEQGRSLSDVNEHAHTHKSEHGLTQQEEESVDALVAMFPSLLRYAHTLVRTHT